jgi:hypothetical protein
MANTTLQQALARFGVVTVMEPTFQKLDLDGQPDGVPFTLDTLRISNFTEEGPRKTAKGGLNAEVVMRYGKTARLEMEDVVGRIEVIQGLFNARWIGDDVEVNGEAQTLEIGDDVVLVQQGGYKSIRLETDVASVWTLVDEADYRILGSNIVLDTPVSGSAADYRVVYIYGETLAVTDSFSGYYSVSGRTFVVDQQTGERDYVNIFVHKFLPDGLLNLTMESEGDFGVFNIAGELFTNDCGVFYEFTKGTQPAGC